VPDIASQFRSFPLDCKQAFFQLNINELVIGSGGNTMKNTRLRKSFRMLEKIAD